MTEEEAYKRGMTRAIWMYAVWREGEQRVGDGTRTYQDALKHVDKDSSITGLKIARRNKGMKYFVVAVSPSINYRGHPTPIMNEDDVIALYDSEKEATEMALQQPLCQAGGYEIIEWPHVG